MDYKVEYTALNELYSNIKNDVNAWLARLRSVETAYENLVSSGNMSGAYADSLKQYLKSTHGTIIPILKETASLLRDNCLLYKQDYRAQIDSASGAVIYAEELEERKGELHLQKRKAIAIADDVEDTLRQIRDIIDLRLGSERDVVGAHDAAARYLQCLDGQVRSFESNHAKKDFEQIKSSIKAVRKMLKRLRGEKRRFKETFSQESFMATAEFAGLLKARIDIQNEQKNKADAVRIAGELEERERFDITGFGNDEPEYARELTSKLKEILDKASDITNGIKKISKKDELSLTKESLDYLCSLIEIWSGEKHSPEDVVSDIASLISSSADMEKGIYEFFEKFLDPKEAEELHGKWGGMLPWLAIISGISDSAAEAFEAGKIYVDPNSTVYDKGAQTLEIGESILSALGKLNISIIANNDKALWVTNEISGKSKIINQILREPTFTISAATKTNIANCTASVTIISSAIEFFSGGIRRAGEVAGDSEYNTGEMIGTIGTHAGLSGLSKFISSITLHIVDFDGEKVADDIDNKVNEFVNSDHWNARFIRDENQFIVFRFGAAIGQGIYFLGEEAVEGTVETYNVVSSTVVTGWEKFIGIF